MCWERNENEQRERERERESNKDEQTEQKEEEKVINTASYLNKVYITTLSIGTCMRWLYSSSFALIGVPTQTYACMHACECTSLMYMLKIVFSSSFSRAINKHNHFIYNIVNTHNHFTCKCDFLRFWSNWLSFSLICYFIYAFLYQHVVSFRGFMFFFDIWSELFMFNTWI